MMTPAKPSTGETIDPALVARMVALVKQVAEYGGTMVNLTEARSIVSDLPDEEDPDIQEARKFCSDHAKKLGAHDLAEEYILGENDHHFAIACALEVVRYKRSNK